MTSLGLDAALGGAMSPSPASIITTDQCDAGNADCATGKVPERHGVDTSAASVMLREQMSRDVLERLVQHSVVS